MSITVSIGGNTHQIPETGETGWGDETTSTLVDLANLKLDFPLLQELDLGATYGIKAITFKSRSADGSTTGVVRLSSGDKVVWRNVGNSADLPFGPNGSDLLEYNGTIVMISGDNVSELVNDAGYLLDITGESIKDLSDVLSSMTPIDGQVLTYDTTNGWQSETIPSGITDHTLLSNIGTNTHAQIDTHIADSTIHFTQASISITKSQVSDFSDGDYATATQGTTADSATQPLDNISTLTNDSGFIADITSENLPDLADVKTPMTPSGGEVLTWNSGNSEWENAPNAPAGGADHGALVGLSDDDHSQYHNDARALTWLNAQSIKELSDVFSTMTPIDGQVLTYDTTNGWQSETFAAGVTDHTLLSNIGTNTHAQIDTHIADGTIHFTQAGISITKSQVSDFSDGDYATAAQGTTADSATQPSDNISTLTNDSGFIADITGESIKDLSDVFSTMTPSDGHVLTYDTTNGWQSEVPSAGVTDHTGLTSIGTNTHAQIDTHIADGSIHFTEASISITESQISDLGDYGNRLLSLNNQTGTTYTLILADGSTTWITMNNAGANTLTVPPNSSVPFSIGSQININQKGAGQTTIVQGSGVTINTPATLLLRAQWSSVTLVKVATDVWTIMGDLEAV